jgi:ubiquinone/menaquinone biosynthesis C-methylase UbiE
MVFDQKAAKLFDQRLETVLGRYIFSRQKELILDLVAPRTGERMLGVDCGTGNYLQLFREKRCTVTGVDSSAEMLKVARNKLGDSTELILCKADDLPFSDNEFDIVTLIISLELSCNPQKVLAEAIRVCRDRVFVGFLNNYSLVGSRQRLKELFGFPLTSNIRFFSHDEIKSMVKGLISSPSISWGSVIYFPSIVYDFLSELDELFPLRKNPFGAFAGLIFPVKYTYRTVQSPIMESYKLKAESQRTATEAIRGMLKDVNK